MLSQTIEGETRESIDLRNRITIEVHTASFRSTRGYAICAALLDELAFWHGEESTDPDTEIVAAIRPAMATIPGAMLLCASSPYARRGALWDAHRRHYAKDNDPILVWSAPTQLMNPMVPERVIAAAYEADPVSAASEYGAQFRADIEGFVTREAVESCVAAGIYERPSSSGTRYSAFVDPAGGSGGDSMTLAIGHEADGIAVVDVLRERRPPFSPEGAVLEFIDTLKTYRITKVTGDRYGGDWPAERFKTHGIKYEAAAKPKSDLYVNLLPAINSRKVDLLDHPKLVAQLVSLERRTGRGTGKDTIDHPPGPSSHDDVANSVAGLVAALAIGASRYDSSLSWVGGPDPNDPAPSWAQPPSLYQHWRFGPATPFMHGSVRFPR
jgi:hypothetical protein